ncbi:type III secretion system ATPase SctN [Pandoraea terrae]|nr:type III secretion system ATPase SctN [Pandoraea terrae]
MKPRRFLQRLATPSRLSGPILEAELKDVSIGEICLVRRRWEDREPAAQAQVVGFSRDKAILSLLGQADGLSRSSLVEPTGAAAKCRPSDAWLGAVLDASGKIVDRFDAGPAVHTVAPERALLAEPPGYGERRGVDTRFHTGVRAIDGLLPCGAGQRIGIFAPAGCGKTSLLQMLMGGVEADVVVVGLIGERGREIAEFVDELRHSPLMQRCVLVFAASDYSAAERCNAALLATTAAEHFRDAGMRVALFIDSLTRYARAHRDLALAAGEPPVRRGFPASVYSGLPHFLERTGATRTGSITAFYTVLLEGDEEPDPMADEIRSILDGHIYLSKPLSERHHFPAIDILRSLSRVGPRVASPEHWQAASRARAMLARIERLQTLVEYGDYQMGNNADDDRALQASGALNGWLQQAISERSTLEQTLRWLDEIIH